MDFKLKWFESTIEWGENPSFADNMISWEEAERFRVLLSEPHMIAKKYFLFVTIRIPGRQGE
jgi:hypothetical protein